MSQILNALYRPVSTVAVGNKPIEQKELKDYLITEKGTLIAKSDYEKKTSGFLGFWFKIKFRFQEGKFASKIDIANELASKIHSFVMEKDFKVAPLSESRERVLNDARNLLRGRVHRSLGIDVRLDRVFTKTLAEALDNYELCKFIYEISEQVNDGTLSHEQLQKALADEKSEILKAIQNENKQSKLEKGHEALQSDLNNPEILKHRRKYTLIPGHIFDRANIISDIMAHVNNQSYELDYLLFHHYDKEKPEYTFAFKADPNNKNSDKILQLNQILSDCRDVPCVKKALDERKEKLESIIRLANGRELKSNGFSNEIHPVVARQMKDEDELEFVSKTELIAKDRADHEELKESLKFKANFASVEEEKGSIAGVENDHSIDAGTHTENEIYSSDLDLLIKIHSEEKSDFIKEHIEYLINNYLELKLEKGNFTCIDAICNSKYINQNMPSIFKKAHIVFKDLQNKIENCLTITDIEKYLDINRYPASLVERALEICSGFAETNDVLQEINEMTSIKDLINYANSDTDSEVVRYTAHTRLRALIDSYDELQINHFLLEISKINSKHLALVNALQLIAETKKDALNKLNEDLKKLMFASEIAQTQKDQILEKIKLEKFDSFINHIFTPTAKKERQSIDNIVDRDIKQAVQARRDSMEKLRLEIIAEQQRIEKEKKKEEKITKKRIGFSIKMF